VGTTVVDPHDVTSPLVVPSTTLNRAGVGELRRGTRAPGQVGDDVELVGLSIDAFIALGSLK
jgi:hypothetical protein